MVSTNIESIISEEYEYEYEDDIIQCLFEDAMFEYDCAREDDEELLEYLADQAYESRQLRLEEY